MRSENQCITCRFGGHQEKSCMAQPCEPKYKGDSGCPLYAMSAQAFMQRVTRAQARIVRLEERAAHYRDMSMRITGSMQGSYVRGSSWYSRVEDNMDAFMDICRDIEMEAKQLRRHLRDATFVISQLMDANEREVLEMRYLSGYDFQAIADRLFINERTVRRIHVKALEHVQREMDLLEYTRHRPGWNPGGAQVQPQAVQ